VFGCACYPNLSAKAAHKLAPRSTRCIFLEYSANHKGYRYLDLTTNNIVVSRHVVFYEADFPFSASPRLTNDLDIFLQDDSPNAAPIPAPLPVPRVPPGFPPLAVGPHLEQRLAVRPLPVQRLAVRPLPCVVRPPGLAPLHRCLLRRLRPPPMRRPRLWLRPKQRSRLRPHHARPQRLTTAAPPVALEPYSLHYSRRPRAAQEPPAPPLHQQSSPAKAVPVAHPNNPHPMITRVKWDFRLQAKRLTLSATSASTFVTGALLRPRRPRRSELASRHGRRVRYLDRQQHLGSCPSPRWLQRRHWQMDFQA
jgi:hypothetical protein